MQSCLCSHDHFFITRNSHAQYTILLARVAHKLHLNRAAGYDALTIENIVYVLPSIYIHLKQLFNLIIKHRHVPYNFRQGYNCAYIIKDKLKDTKDASNYRPVTIGNNIIETI